MLSFFKKRLRSFGYALRGIVQLFKTETHAKLHLLAAIAVVGLGFLLRVSSTDWAILVLCIALVIVAEALNTAIEATVDLVSPDYHVLARKAKDVAAGAVLLAAIAAAIIAVIIFLPKIFTLLLAYL